MNVTVRVSQQERDEWSDAAADSASYRSRSSWIRDVLNRSARTIRQRREAENVEESE